MGRKSTIHHALAGRRLEFLYYVLVMPTSLPGFNFLQNVVYNHLPIISTSRWSVRPLLSRHSQGRRLGAPTAFLHFWILQAGGRNDYPILLAPRRYSIRCSFVHGASQWRREQSTSSHQMGFQRGTPYQRQSLLWIYC